MSDLTNTTLGSCQIVKLLGKGGMGEIYLAQQPLLQRTVAVKVIRADSAHSASSVKHFEHEARALAALEHPHIVPLYEFGFHNEIAYIVMPYISGGTLRDRLQQGALPPLVVVRLLEQLATALDFAHQKAIVHRDIKPANVLLRDNNWPLLSDFGIAKLLASITQSTRSHVGTPFYMAPEQWTGQQVSSQTDIYALAIMLYELLTGQPPFKGSDWGSVMRQHLQDPPASICARNPTVPPALEQVLFQAMAKEPAQRFLTVNDFALAARQALEGKNTPPEQPTPGTPLSPIFQAIPTNWRADPFVVPPAFDPRQTPTARISQDGAQVQSVLSPTATTGAPETQPAISSYPTLKAEQPAFPRQWLTSPVLLAEWRSVSSTMDTLAFLPEAGKIVSSTLNTIFLWETASPHPVAQLSGHTRSIWAIALTADGQLLASGSWDRSIRLWDMPQRKLRRTLIGHGDIILSLALAMNNRILISGSRDGTLRCWELPGGRQLNNIRHPGGPVWSLVTLPADDLVVAGAEDGKVGLWNLKNGQAVWNISLGDVGPVHRLLSLPAQQLLCITQKGSLALLNLAAGAVQKAIAAPAAPLDHAVALENEIIYADTGGTLYRWNVESGEHHQAVRAHQRRILAMAVQPSTGVIATSSEDRSMKLWQFI